MGLGQGDAQVVAQFDAIDLDHDNYISKDELSKFISDRRALHSEKFEEKGKDFLTTN